MPKQPSTSLQSPRGTQLSVLTTATAEPAPRRTQSGEATADVVLSSVVGDNSSQFRDILRLHVPGNATIADVTFGKGVFWSNVDRRKYNILGSDLHLKHETVCAFPDLQLKSGIDFGALPYASNSLDALVLDPPYMEGFYRQDPNGKAGGGSHTSFRHAYSSGKEEEYHTNAPVGRLAWQDRVIDAYIRGAQEAYRTLRQDGIFIVKCQDAVSANIQRLAHVELITAFEHLGFYCKDLFILTRPARPGVSRLIRQNHARKNHSYFLIFTKPRRRPLASSCYHCRRQTETLKEDQAKTAAEEAK